MIFELSSRDLNRIYSVDLLVSKYYKTSLYSFCSKYHYDTFFLGLLKEITKDYNYGKSNYLEIELDSEELEERYYELEKKFSYGADNRGVIERVISLGVNWVVEDVIVHKSSSVFILTGCDNARDLTINNITNTPDIRYVGKGESFYVEVCSDFTQFMKKNRRYDIRKLKYCKLEDLLYIEKKKTVLLFVDVINKSFYRCWFKSKDTQYHNKYGYNNISFEFDNSVEFKSLDDIFKSCKDCQSNPSLYSNFNIEEIEPVKKLEKQYDELSDDGYWSSLYANQPAFIKDNVPDYSDNSLEDISDEEANRESGFGSSDTLDKESYDIGIEETEFKECEDAWTPWDEDSPF